MTSRTPGGDCDRAAAARRTLAAADTRTLFIHAHLDGAKDRTNAVLRVDSAP
jgi:hypothetical protein